LSLFVSRRPMRMTDLLTEMLAMWGVQRRNKALPNDGIAFHIAPKVPIFIFRNLFRFGGTP